MIEKIKIIVIVFLFTLIPNILIYSSKSDSFLDSLKSNGIIGPKVPIKELKDYLLIVGMVLSAILLSVKLAFTEINNKELLKQRNCFLKSFKNSFEKDISKELKVKTLDIEVRIFVPKIGVIPFIKRSIEKMTLDYFKFRKDFVIKNLEGLANQDSTRNLKLQVYPNPEGLVGKCYNTKSVQFDNSLNEKVNKDKYNFSEFQISCTQDIKFVFTYPIFDENNRVISIVSFDTKQRIEMNDKNFDIWKQKTYRFCSTLYQYVPDIFK